MSRNTRFLIVVGIGVVTAVLSSLGMYLAISRRPLERVPVPASTVVVAAKPIEMGVTLTAEHVRLVAWPTSDQIAGSFAKTDDVLNRGLMAAVVANEPITEGKLAPLGAGAGLPLAIKPGMRAMSVKVNEVIGVAGFVVPGTKVDVLVTIPTDGGSVSRVVVSNVQVLTAGTRYDEMEVQKEAKPIPSTVVTLMVWPGDAEKITLAATEGQIMLALRNPLDTEVTETTGVSTASLTGGVTRSTTQAVPTRPTAGQTRRPAPPRPPETTPTPTDSRKVFVTIKGMKVEQEVVQ